MVTFSLEKAFVILVPLVLLSLAILLFGAFLFFFYHFIARRDFFDLNLQQHSEKVEREWLQKTLNIILYILEYIILLPTFILIWFGIFATIILLLSSDLDPTRVLLIAMGIVTSIRVFTYFSEELARELAKLLPFILLATLLVGGSNSLSISGMQETLFSIPMYMDIIIYYLLFAMMVEFTLRAIFLLFTKEE